MRGAVRSLVALCAALTFTVAPSHAVVGGRVADTGEYPWMAAIYTGSSPANGQYCGGSLVAPRVVVSAAHCVSELLDNAVASLPTDVLGMKVKVMLGKNRLSQHASAEKIIVSTLRVHPNRDLDLAVLQLSSSSRQTPIAWARPGQESYWAPGTLASVVGWGATREGGNGSDQLLEADVPIMSDNACAMKYPGRTVPATEVCAGYDQGGIDTCQGDSGGPLMVPGPGGKMLLVGATSWGDGCAQPNRPGVYAEIAAGSAFIDQYA